MLKMFFFIYFSKGHFADVVLAKQFAERINLIYFHLYFFSGDLAHMKDLKRSKENVSHRLISMNGFKWCIIFDNHGRNLLFQEWPEDRHL